MKNVKYLRTSSVYSFKSSSPVRQEALIRERFPDVVFD
jgi:hypothetical protein